MNEFSIPDDNRLLTVDDVARQWNVPVSWVYSNPGLPRIKVGRYVRFRPADLEKYLQIRQQRPRS